MRIKTLAESFASYRTHVLPIDAPAVQVTECQRAFYAGAYTLLMDSLLNIGDESTDEEDGIAQLEAIRAECEAFAAAAPADPNAAAFDSLEAMRRAAAASGVLFTGPDRVPYTITVPDIHHEAPAPLVADMRPLLERLGHRIGDDLPAGWGFALFLFQFGQNGHTFYIANCERADVLTALHEFIRRQTS